MNRIKFVTNWYISITVSIAFAICAAVYFKAIEGLAKPAGIIEAFKFLTSFPKEYALCLICGGLAKISFIMIVVIAIVSFISLCLLFFTTDDGYEKLEIKDMIRYIVNCVLAIIIGIVQAKIISYFWLLVITIGIVIFVIYSCANSN